MGLVAIYGGAFDPPHHGHLFAIQVLLSREDISEVWLLPTYAHAFGKSMTDFDTRCAWLETCIEQCGWRGRVRVDRMERELGTMSRTFETLTQLQLTHPTREFCCVIGADNLAVSDKWHRFDDIVAQWPFIVFGRPGYESTFASYAQEDWCHQEVTLPDLASSSIREGIKNGSKEMLLAIPNPIRNVVNDHFRDSRAINQTLDQTVRILGLGRLGGSLNKALTQQGYRVLSWTRSYGPLPEFFQRSPMGKNDIVIVAVSDAAIRSVLLELTPFLSDQQVVLHCAGSQSAACIEGVGPERSGVLHPIHPIATRETSLSGLIWGTSGGAIATHVAHTLVKSMDGQSIELHGAVMALYHAAMVVVGNFPIALHAVAATTLQVDDKYRAVAEQALVHLHESALTNLANHGIENALTGPIVRRDLTTIRKHVRVLRGVDPKLSSWYAITSEILAQRIGWTAGTTAAFEAEPLSANA